MRVLLLCLGLTILGTAARAESVPVRSGEHDGFSRLVLHLPNRLEWVLSGSGAERSLEVENPDIVFLTDTVFSRLTQDRIKAVSQFAGRPVLQLSLGCKCDVSASWAGTSMLVLDVRDRGSDPVAQIETQADLTVEDQDGKPPHAAASILSETHLRTPLIAPDTQTFPLSTGLIAAGLSERFSEIDGGSIQPDLPQDESAAIVADGQGNLQDISGTLARQIGRAASQGLLTPIPGGLPLHSADVPIDDTVPVLDQAELPDAQASEPPVNVSAHTSMDHGFEQIAGQRLLVKGGDTCPPSGTYKITKWAEAGAFSHQVGELRAALALERDRVDGVTALHLARVYVYFGFGAEAQQVLDMANVNGRDATIVRDLAEIMELGRLEQGSELSDFLHCETDAAFWAALSFQELPPGAPIAEDAVLRSVNELPQHLRDYLGPILARRLLQAGQNLLADKILRILRRDHHDGTQAEHLAMAEADLHEEELALADQRLGEVVDGNSDLSAQALLHRIDTRLTSGREIPADMAELAGAYAVELRHQSIGQELARAYLEAMAATGNFDMAFREFARLTPDLTPDDRDRVNNTVLRLLTQNASDVDFVGRALTIKEDDPSQISPVVSNLMAQRLLDLGFLQVALTFVGEKTNGPDEAGRRRIRAKLALAMGQPRQAEVELLGLHEPDDNIIRAQARSRVGEHAIAQTLFQSSGQVEDATRAAIHAGDWARVRQSDRPQMVEISELMMRSDQDRSFNPTTPIASGRDLLDASAASRSVLAAFLISRPGPE